MGGTIGLAIAGTIFGSVVLDEVPKQMVAGGVPPEVGAQLPLNNPAFFNSITSVGDIGAAILAAAPEAARPVLEPLIPSIVGALHQGISIATGATFVLGIAALLAAAVVVLVLMPAGRIGHADGT